VPAHEIKLLSLTDVFVESSFLVLGRNMGTPVWVHTWGILILGNPVTVLWLSVVSGYLIELTSWRGMFIIEGVPAVIWAFVFRKMVADRPRDAAWLDPAERDAVESALAAEQAAIKPVRNWGAAMRSRNVVLLSVQYLLWSLGIYGFVFWLPTIVKAGSGQGIGLRHGLEEAAAGGCPARRQPGRGGLRRHHVLLVEHRARELRMAGEDGLEQAALSPAHVHHGGHAGEVVGLGHRAGDRGGLHGHVLVEDRVLLGVVAAPRPGVHPVRGPERVLAGAHAVAEVPPRRPQRGAVQGPGQRPDAVGHVRAQTLAQPGVAERAVGALVVDPDRAERMQEPLQGVGIRAHVSREIGGRARAADEPVGDPEIGRHAEGRGQPETRDHGAQLGSFGHGAIILGVVPRRQRLRMSGQAYAGEAGSSSGSRRSFDSSIGNRSAFWRSIAAPISPANSGCGRVGRDRSSGWACVET